MQMHYDHFAMVFEFAHSFRAVGGDCVNTVNTSVLLVIYVLFP